MQTLSSFDFLYETVLQRADFLGVLNFVEVPRDTWFIEYFDEIDYLHFALISNAKVIASRLLPKVSKVRNTGFASEF